jgi:predicted transcriptional regulator
MKAGSDQAKARTQMLVELRKQHEATVQKAQELLKNQQTTRKKLRKAMEAGPASVPALASTTGIPSHEVLWHIAAMKKYGLVEEDGVDKAKEYYEYTPAKELKS